MIHAIKYACMGVVLLLVSPSFSQQQKNGDVKNIFSISIQSGIYNTSSYTYPKGNGQVEINKSKSLMIPLVSLAYYRRFSRFSTGAEISGTNYAYPFSILTANFKYNLKSKPSEMQGLVLKSGVRYNYDNFKPIVGVGIEASKNRLFVSLNYLNTIIPDKKEPNYLFKESALLIGLGVLVGKAK
jgi:hypothetical protein